MTLTTAAYADMVEHIAPVESLILGLGKTGLSCARYLAWQGMPFAVADSRSSPPELETFSREFPGIQVHLGAFDPALLAAAGRLLISPGISPADPAISHAVDAGVTLTGDIELFAGHAKAPVVAVTGSNGKSTVASLVTAMIREAGLDAALGGNIGTPALSLLGLDEPDYYVLELSSFQLETVTSLNAAAAVVLNVSADHMDRYRDLADYAAVKQKVYAGTGVMVVNADDAIVAAMGMPDRRQQIAYTLGAPGPQGYGISHTGDGEWLSRGHELLMRAENVPLAGRHNLSNALAALALGEAIGLKTQPMIGALRQFRGLPHRCEWIGEAGGISWINDSKGTNPGASIAAIEGLAGDNDVVLIAGGDGKGADFAPLAAAASGRVHTAVLIGRDAGKIAAVLEGQAALIYASDMDSAVNQAARVAQPGDKVLLSPACASLDMYRDYQDRGRAFRRAVENLIHGGAGER